MLHQENLSGITYSHISTAQFISCLISCFPPSPFPAVLLPCAVCSQLFFALMFPVKIGMHYCCTWHVNFKFSQRH